MTERQRRQARLLAVRTLQADLARIELSRLKAEQRTAQTRLDTLAQFEGSATAHLGRVEATHEGWLLACAEQSLAAIMSKRVFAEVSTRVHQIQAQATQEQQARTRREQISRLCERTSIATHTERERRTQAGMDDLFNAARVQGGGSSR